MVIGFTSAIESKALDLAEFIFYGYIKGLEGLCNSNIGRKFSSYFATKIIKTSLLEYKCVILNVEG